MIRTRSYATLPLGASDGEDFYNSFSIATWGDSLTQGIPGEREPWQDFLAGAGLGFRRIYNGGIGGENSEEIRDRMLADTARHTWATVIWAGRNDKSDFGSWGQRTIDAIADMTDALEAAGNTRYIVLGVTNNGGEYAAAGGTAAANYAEIVALNASLESIYGTKFWDVREWLIANGLTVMGITPTAGDLIDISRDVIPTSLRVDATNVHFNTDGNEAIAIGMVPLLEAMVTTDYTLGYRALVAALGSGIAADTVQTDVLYIGMDKSVNGGKFLEAQPVYGNTYAGHLRGISANFDPIVTLDNTVFGYGKLDTTPNMYGRANTIFGSNSGAVLTTGSFNTLHGAYAGTSLTTGTGHVFVGHLAGDAKVGGTGDTFVGRYAGAKSTSTNAATYIGYQAGYNTVGGDGTLVGYQAGVSQTSGRFNVGLGESALALNQTGSRYVALGYSALSAAVTTGTAIGIGYAAADNLTTGSGVFIGYNIDAQSATAAGQLSIQNIIFGTGIDDGTGTTVSSGKIGIRQTTPLCTLDVSGSFGLGAPVTKTADFSLAITENYVICNKAGSSCVVTLGSASAQAGRRIVLQNYQAGQTVTSLNTNVVPLGGGAAGTAILAAGAGKWAELVADGTNWTIMAAGG